MEEGPKKGQWHQTCNTYVFKAKCGFLAAVSLTIEGICARLSPALHLVDN